MIACARNIFDESQFSTELFKDALKSYHNVFDGLTPQRKYIIDQMCNMFEVSAVAYRAAVSARMHKECALGFITEAGTLAYQTLIHFDLIKEAFGLDDDATFEKIDATSSWLEERGWTHLPEPKDENGAKHMKTAAGLVSDMRGYVKVYNDMMKHMKAMKEEVRGVA